MFKLGKDRNNGDIISIVESKRGLRCDCVCPDCGLDFIAAQGEKNEWHFRHKSETLCNGGQETAIHLLAKDIIIRNNQIELPLYGTVFYSDAVKERQFQKIRPDVTVSVNEQNLFIEVLVTHRVDSFKENFYIDGKHKSVEIDLRGYSFTTAPEFEKEILHNSGRKRIIFWHSENDSKKVDFNSLLKLTTLALLAFFGLRFLLRNRKRRRLVRQR